MDWINGLLRLLGIGRSNAAGWDRLNVRQNDWIDRIMKRLDECDTDRRELHRRADECDDDRAELRERLNTLETRTNAT